MGGAQGRFDPLRSAFFWGVLLLKLAAAGIFASDYLADLFIPFLEHFARDPLNNPYDAFLERGELRSFPYPAFMLYGLEILRLPLGLLGLSDPGPRVAMLLYRLPLLAADIGILLILCRWITDRGRAVMYLYWGSPVLFYITYLHGQLDALPVFLLVASVFLLLRERSLLSALVFACGMAAKTNLFVILPFIGVHIWQNTHSPRRVLQYGAVAVAGFVAINLPYLFSDGFITMVLMNAEQKKVAAAQIQFATQLAAFYVVPALLIVLLVLSLKLRIHNRDVFLAFIGFAFGTFLLFIAPMQGWYFWVMPFFAYFFALMPRIYGLAFVGLQASYLLYFAFIPQSDYLLLAQPGATGGPTPAGWLRSVGIDPQQALDISFTLLQTALILCCGAIYYRGILTPQRRTLSARPFMLGIAGDSGAGKSTISAAVTRLFGERSVEVICGDDMHKWQRGHVRWRELTHLDPRANELHDELRYLNAIRRNRTIWRRHYDHSTGRFTEELPIRPRSVMVLEGLHTFYLKAARDMFDLKVFMKPQQDLMVHRKVLRDMKDRSYSKEKVLETILRRMEDSKKYIVVQEDHADVVISFMAHEPVSDIGNPDLVIREWLRVTLVNSFFLDPLVDVILSAAPDSLHHYFDQNDRQVLEFAQPLSADQIRLIGERLVVGGLEDLGIYQPGWQDGWMGMVQLILGYCIFHGWKEHDDV